MARPDVARPRITVEEARAVKCFSAYAEGGPPLSPWQSKLIIEFILRETGTDRDCWAATERETAFLLGRRSFGLTFREMMLLPIEKLIPEKRRKAVDPTNSSPPEG